MAALVNRLQLGGEARWGCARAAIAAALASAAERHHGTVCDQVTAAVGVVFIAATLADLYLLSRGRITPGSGGGHAIVLAMLVAASVLAVGARIYIC